MNETGASVRFGEQIHIKTMFGDFWLRHAHLGDKSGIVILPSFEFDEFYVRIQSSCLFSESFTSIDCDCADQLTRAMEIISSRGGLLVYAFEEGRGAGLDVKIRAIGLQQRLGVDTATAFNQLGLPPDPRDHEFAAMAVRELTSGRPVVLLTNNPSKVHALSAMGVNVSRREPLIVADTPLTKRYLAEKSRVLGHLVAEGE